MKSLRVAVLGASALTVGLLAFSGCGTVKDPWEGKGSPPRTVTSFGPIFCFAKNVAKDGTAIVCLSTSKGPHQYQYSHSDTLYLKEANLLLSNGLGLDDGFIDKMTANSGNPNLKYVKLGDNLGDLLIENKEDEHDHAGHDHHHHGKHDPHVWLGITDGKGNPGPAIVMVHRIRDHLKNVDPTNSAVYDANAKKYLAKLDELQNYGATKLNALKDKPGKKGISIVTSHESMAYFARSFGLNVVGSIRIRPDLEASSQHLTNLIKKCKDMKPPPRIITIEPQYPSNAAETLKIELGKAGLKDIKLVTLDPLETCDVSKVDKDWFERKMRENIDNLANAVQ